MMLQRRKRPIRRGAAMVEAAIILPAFLTMALGTIDLGLAVFQNHQVAEASRQGARIASVHGSQASQLGVWGPNAYSGAGNAADTIPTAFRTAGAFGTLNTANVTVSVSWPDGSNNSNPASPTFPATYRVQVTVSTTWTPLVFYVFGNKTVTLSATSIMPIAH
jgi:Flp pilus assembly protein TadG